MLLALDINSRRTGYAFGGPSDEKPRSGVWNLPGGEDSCKALMGSVRLFCSHIARPKIVLIEAPMQATERSAHTAKILIMLFGCAWAVADDYGAIPKPVHIGTWRKHFIGAGNLPGDESKRLALKRCQQLGWNAENHDQAEACGIWDYGIATFMRRATLMGVAV